jgi:hypothetical protein
MNCVPHIPQFACVFFTKSLEERICKVEFIHISAIENGLSPKFSKKLLPVGWNAHQYPFV